MLIKNDDGTTRIFFADEHLEIARYTERLESAIWQRFAACAVMAGSLLYVLFWR